MNKENEEVMMLLDDLYVPKKHKDAYSELVNLIGSGEIERIIPGENTPENVKLPLLEIKTAGKGKRETFKGFEKGTFEVIAVCGRYCYGYCSTRQQFARLSSDSPRVFIYKEN